LIPKEEMRGKIGAVKIEKRTGPALYTFVFTKWRIHVRQ